MRYSPYPADNYSLTTGTNYLSPLDESDKDEAIWNLAWLSIPHIDSYLDLAYKDFKAYKSLNEDFPFHVKVRVDAELKSRPELRQILTTLSPAEFLKVLTPKFYTSLHLYKRGGDDWLTTVRCRAEAAQARLDTEQLAAKAENVMVVDFKLRNGNLQRPETEPKILANSQSVDAKPNDESPKPERKDKDENKRFIGNSDGTVTDSISGLAWMRCLLGQSIEHNKCTGTPNTYTWENAMMIRHRHAGYEDWRLPTVDELESIFGSQSDRSENKAAFPWLVYEDVQNHVSPSTCFWSSTTWKDDAGLAVGSYYPDRADVVSCGSEHLDEPYQILLVRSIEDTAGAASDANLAPPVTTNGSVLNEKSSSAIDDTNATCPIMLLHNLVDRFDRLETRFEVMMNRIESLTHSLLLAQSQSATGVLLQARTARIDNTLPVETTRLEFLYWLAEQPEIVLADLRTRLLPLDLLPSAVINDINECAIDLTGEHALKEGGDNVIVRREVLLQVIAALESNGAKLI